MGRYGEIWGEMMQNRHRSAIPAAPILHPLLALPLGRALASPLPAASSSASGEGGVGVRAIRGALWLRGDGAAKRRLYDVGRRRSVTSPHISPPVFKLYRYETGIWRYFDQFWSGMV